MGEVLSLGSVNVDVQVRAERPPEAGETLLATEFLLQGGGKAANVAVTARRLGARARVFGRIGTDWLGHIALLPLQREGVDISDVRVVEGASTAVSVIVVGRDGQKGIVLASNANERWTISDAREVERTFFDLDASERYVLVVDLEVPPRIVLPAMRAARSRSIPIVLDPSPASRVDDEMLALADVITPNASEAEALTSIRVASLADAARAAEHLLVRGASAALVKVHDGGCVAMSREHALEVRAPKVRVVDKTGAGDAFAGALATALVEGRGLSEAARFAVAAATHAVGRWGSQAAYADRAELDGLLAQIELGRAPSAA